MKNKRNVLTAILGSLSLVPGLFAQGAIAQDSSQAAVEAAESFDKLPQLRFNTATASSDPEDAVVPGGSTSPFDSPDYKLISAIRDNDAAKTTYYLSQGADANGETDQRSMPLRVAVANGNRAIAQILLRHGADVNLQDDSGQTALVRAAWDGNADMIRFLLEQGANPNLQDYHGKSPLFHAAIYGKANVAVVEAFLEKGADVDLRDESGSTPFMIAAGYNHNSTALKLMGRRVRDINTTDRAGRTALMKAAWQNEFDNSPTIKALFELGADPNRKDFKGETALMKTALLGNAESTHALLQHPDIDVNARNAYGETAQALAREMRLKSHDNTDYPRVISLLTKHGAQN